MMPYAPITRKPKSIAQTESVKDEGTPVILQETESLDGMNHLMDLASIVESLGEYEIDSEMAEYLSAIDQEVKEEQMIIDGVETSSVADTSISSDVSLKEKINLSADEVLDELVKSNFADLNILSQWDKIKKS
jgi:hypothetical protein